MFICIHSRSLQEKDVFKSHAKLLFLREMWGCHVSLSTFPSFFIRSSADFPPTTKRAKKLSAFSSFPEWKLCGTEKSAGMYSHLFPTMYETKKRRRKRKKGIIRREREKWQIAFSAKGEKKPQKREFGMKEEEKKWTRTKVKNLSRFFCSQSFEISKRHTHKKLFLTIWTKGPTRTFFQNSLDCSEGY